MGGLGWAAMRPELDGGIVWAKCRPGPGSVMGYVAVEFQRQSGLGAGLVWAVARARLRQ